MNKYEEDLTVESKKYVDKILPIILKNLDKETFLQYACDELIKAVSPEKFNSVFEIYHKLGKFRKYIGSKGKAKISFSFRDKKFIFYASYTAYAKFSNSDAEIKITIIKEKSTWKIYYFKINSKVFNNFT